MHAFGQEEINFWYYKLLLLSLYSSQFFWSVSVTEQINEGLDRAVMTMKKGEQATVTVSSDFFNGYQDLGFVSAKSTIIYEVELIDFSKV